MLTLEDDLVPRLRARDERAMTEFYQHYHPALLTAVMRLVRNRQTAEDLLQEGMLKVWFSIEAYDPERGRLFTWAARICCNAAIDHLRTGRARLAARSATLEDSPALHLPAPTEFHPEHIGVTDWLLPLKPHHRQVLDLLYLQGYTQGETAAALQVPVGTVKTWAGRARVLLAQRLQTPRQRFA